MVEPISSDLVHDTLLTTQDPHLVGQGMHAGAYPNDTNTNTEASPVLTGDSVQNSPISFMELEVPSQVSGDDAVIHPITMEIASCSTGIPHLSHQPGTSSIPSVTVAESFVVVASSNLQQWLKPVQHDSASGSQSVPPLSSEALHEMSVAQVEEFSKLAQHLLIANLPNADYEAILLYHKQDMDAKSLTPTEVYDAVNEVYKAQLKAIHYLGKGFKSEIESVWRETTHRVNELKLQYATDFPKVDGIFKKVK